VPWSAENCAPETAEAPVSLPLIPKKWDDLPDGVRKGIGFNLYLTPVTTSYHQLPPVTNPSYPSYLNIVKKLYETIPESRRIPKSA